MFFKKNSQKGSAGALPKPKVGQNNRREKACVLLSTSPNATIVRTDLFNLAEAMTFIRLHFDKFLDPVHFVQAHNDQEKPSHIKEDL